MPKDVGWSANSRPYASMCSCRLAAAFNFSPRTLGSSCTSGFAQPLEGSAGQSEKATYELDALRRALIDGTYKGPSKLLLHPEDFWGWKKTLSTQSGLYVATSWIEFETTQALDQLQSRA